MDALLPGKLAYVFYVSVVDAAILSVIALLWFRHSVRALMRSASAPASLADVTGAIAPPAAAAAQTSLSSPAALSFALFESAPSAPDVRLDTASEGPLRRRLTIAYALGAVAYSLVMTAFQLVGEDPALPFVAWLARVWVNAWPLLPSLVALLVADRRSTLRLALLYLLIGVAAEFGTTLAGQLSRGTLNAAPITNLYWMVASLVLTIYAPLVLIVISGWRRIRSVMPIALAGVIVFGFALLAFGSAMISMLDRESVRSSIVAASTLTSVRVVYYGLFLIASLPVGWLAWRLLRWIANGFERKRFSDVQLIVDCWWMIVAAEQASLLSTTRGYIGVVAGLAAFAAYRVVVAVMLRHAPGDRSPRRLLLLRVFGYQQRTEKLFDRVAQAWRFEGPVQLIAGVDLASRTATPGAILRLLSGSLRQQYIANAADIQARIAQLDGVPDRDGRFRINNVYCHDDTWRGALTALLEASDCVLMDLRGFSARNQGCVFELEQLLLRVPLASVVLVVDDGTDLRLLGQTLTQSWTRAFGSVAGTLSLVFIQARAANHLASLMSRLKGLGTPDRIVAGDALALARTM